MNGVAQDTTLSAALKFARRGWQIFPCSGKTPLTPHGLKDATSTDTGLIEGWWNSWPDANVAVVTGSASGIVVLDIDIGKEDGYESLRKLEAEHGALPTTASVKTPSGGAHLYFRHPGTDIRNSVKQLGPGLDIRGDGGYVIAPPSTGYVVDEEAPVAEFPKWILENAARKKAKTADPIGERIPDGQRNATLASLAGSMRRRGASEAEILAALEVANRERCQPPLPADEVAKIAASVARYAPANGSGADSALETRSARAQGGNARSHDYVVTFTETKPPKLVLPDVPAHEDLAGQAAWLSSVLRLDNRHPITAAVHEGLRGPEGHVVLRRADAPPIRFEPAAVMNTARRLRPALTWQLMPTDGEPYGFKDDHCGRIAHVARLLCGACAAPVEAEETSAIVGMFISDAITIAGCSTYGDGTARYEALSALQARVDEQTGRVFGQSHCLIDSATGEYVIRVGDLQIAARRHTGNAVPHGWLDARMQNLGWERINLQGHERPGQNGSRGAHLRAGVYRGILAFEEDKTSR